MDGKAGSVRGWRIERERVQDVERRECTILTYREICV